MFFQLAVVYLFPNLNVTKIAEKLKFLNYDKYVSQNGKLMACFAFMYAFN